MRKYEGGGTGEGRFRVPHSIAIDRRGDVYVADRENSRVQIFDAAGTYRAQWLSRVASAGQRHSYSRHVSSIAYNPVLDLFAVTEGDAVQLRTPSGCSLVETEGGMQWPHDAVLIPSDALGGKTAPNRSAVAHGGGQYALFVAELSGRRIKRYNAGPLALTSETHQGAGSYG